MRLNAVLQVGTGQNPSEAAAHLDPRKAGRRSLTLKTVASSPCGEELRVTIQDISPQGFLIESENEALSEGEVITMNLPEIGIATARVMWTSSRHYGCKLDKAIPPGAIGAALLRADARVMRDDTNFQTRVVHDDRCAPAEGFKPELNFSVAFYLSLALWAVIGLVIYTVVG